MQKLIPYNLLKYEFTNEIFHLKKKIYYQTMVEVTLLSFKVYRWMKLLSIYEFVWYFFFKMNISLVKI